MINDNNNHRSLRGAEPRGARQEEAQRGGPQRFQGYGLYPLFESDTLFLECCVCAVLGCSATLRIEGCLNSPL